MTTNIMPVIFPSHGHLPTPMLLVNMTSDHMWGTCSAWNLISRLHFLMIIYYMKLTQVSIWVWFQQNFWNHSIVTRTDAFNWCRKCDNFEDCTKFDDLSFDMLINPEDWGIYISRKTALEGYHQSSYYSYSRVYIIYEPYGFEYLIL